ncbi:MAG TPA: hypothetical protein VLC53_08520, partial [Myxococcota bacterium]|nr:hypothetical protein [Myxococcota bacterium]
MLASPAHRAAIAFLRGGLLAIVGLLAPPRVAAMLAGAGAGERAATVVALLLPVLGFALAGAFGGAALGLGRRGAAAFAAGGAVTGLGISIAWPQFAGLTGHEPILVLTLFALGTWAAAFGAGGGVAAWAVDRRAIRELSRWFAIGGALGAILFVAPSLLVPLGFREWPPMIRVLISTLTSVTGLLAPFGIG